MAGWGESGEAFFGLGWWGCYFFGGGGEDAGLPPRLLPDPVPLLGVERLPLLSPILIHHLFLKNYCLLLPAYNYITNFSFYQQ